MSDSLRCPRSPRHQRTSDGGNAWLQRNLHEIKFSTWLTRVTRPGLPACSFIIPGLITDWTGCLVCLMPAQLLHGRNGLVTLAPCYNTLYYHFIYLAQILCAHQCKPPSQTTLANQHQPTASFRKLLKMTCPFSLWKCHMSDFGFHEFILMALLHQCSVVRRRPACCSAEVQGCFNSGIQLVDSGVAHLLLDSIGCQWGLGQPTLLANSA